MGDTVAGKCGHLLQKYLQTIRIKMALDAITTITAALAHLMPVMTVAQWQSQSAA